MKDLAKMLATEFWQAVRQTDGFGNLCQYALTCLLIPSSNAVVARMFSLLTSTKTKPRNRLGVQNLDSIIRIKSYAQMRGQCCTTLTMTEKMMDLHTANGQRHLTERAKRRQLTFSGASIESTNSSISDLQEEDEALDGILAFLDYLLLIFYLKL